MSSLSWTQKWVDQVTSRRFRNFSMPRTSLFRHFRPFSRTQEPRPTELKTGNPPGGQDRQLFGNPEYNAPFDDINFAVAKAADVKQRNDRNHPGIDTVQHHQQRRPHRHHHQARSHRLHHHHHHHHQSSYESATFTNDSTTTTTTTEDFTPMDCSRSSCRETDQSAEEKTHHVVPIIIGTVCFLALIAVITVAVYLKLARTTDPKPVDKHFEVEMEVQLISQEFVGDMQNQSSPAVQDFADMFCNNMTAIYSADTELGRYRGCSVKSLSQVSKVVDFGLFFTAKEAPTEDQVMHTLLDKAFVHTAGIVLRTGLEIAKGTARVTSIAQVSLEDIGGRGPVTTSDTMSTPSSSNGTTEHSPSNTTEGPNATTETSTDLTLNHTIETSTNSTLDGTETNTNSALNYTETSTNSTLDYTETSTNSSLNYTETSTNSALNYTEIGTTPELNDSVETSTAFTSNETTESSANSTENQTAETSTSLPLTVTTLDNTTETSTNSTLNDTTETNENSELNVTETTTNSESNMTETTINPELNTPENTSNPEVNITEITMTSDMNITETTITESIMNSTLIVTESSTTSEQNSTSSIMDPTQNDTDTTTTPVEASTGNVTSSPP